MDPWLEAFARAGFSRSVDTAHDLKTPLNIAVLNLELLRMRLRKLAGATDDEKVMAYAQAIELELRRMARIFDTFFVLSTPPKGNPSPELIDVSAICTEAAAAAGLPAPVVKAPLKLRVHEARIRQAFKLFFEGAAKLLEPDGRRVEVESDAQFLVTVTGTAASGELDLTKIFKFYYTDPTGNPDLSLAAARLIAETYGGELNAAEESGNVVLRMSVPPGEE